MIRPIDETPDPDLKPSPNDHDEQVGEAIEEFLRLIEQGEVPDPDRFAAKYPDLQEDVLAALQGLELVNGLVGHLPGGSSSGSSARPGGPGRSLESGRRIAGYRIVRELGRGGMGTVYEAVHIALDRPVALKILGSHAAPDSSTRRRFLNEARTAARLHHTNIVPVFDVGQVGGLCYYAMQRIEGTGLDHVLRRSRRSRNQLGGAASPITTRDETARSRVTTSSLSPSNSSPSSRLGQFWFRVSAGWLKRPIQEASGSKASDEICAEGAEDVTGFRPSRPRDVGDTRPSIGNGADDSTGSWGGLNPVGPNREQRRREHGARPSSLPFSSSAVFPAHEFLPGRAEDVEEESPFSPPRGSAFYRWVAEVGLQAAEALAHAHHQGVIHRDVKPSNLLIDAKGTVWVTDFGLARRLADPGLTQHDSLLGTPRYMSPEQARPGAIDGRTDVFSLGGTLYELLTLRPAFDGKSAAELVEQIAKVDPPLPRSIDPRIPRDLETIVLKMLAKRPADRYSSAAGLAEDLARFLNHEPVKARRISPVGRLWRVARRHPGITGVSTAAAAAIVALVIYDHVRVVAERDKLEKANSLYLRQLRTSHWQNAALIRLSPGLLERRSRGLEMIKKAADLSPDPDLKQKLRDEAVDFLVLRDVEKSVELDTGWVRNLAFAESGSHLAALTESQDGELLTFWDVDQSRPKKSIPIGLPPRPNRSDRPSASPQPERTAAKDSAIEASSVEGDGTSSKSSAAGPSPRPGDGGGRPTPAPPPSNFGRRPAARMALAGPTIAVILPTDRTSRIAEAFIKARTVDAISLALAGRTVPVFAPRDRGLRLFDATSGQATGDLITPMGSLQGVYGGANGARLVTIDQEFLAGGGGDSPRRFEVRFEANLWDPQSPHKPIASLELPMADMAMTMPGSSPHVGFSPDGEKIVLGWGTLASIFSAKDGAPLGRIDTQTQLTALAIGPNDLLATTGVGNVRLWDMESREILSSLTPSQNYISLMRFGPEGSVLALVGRNESTIELIDPVGPSQIALLRTADRVQDLAFSPDGQRLSAGGQGPTTTVWKILGSTARAQLSGFDATATSLAFDKDGFLAIGTNRGEIWGCRPSKYVGASCKPLFSGSADSPAATAVSTVAPASRPNVTEPFPIGAVDLAAGRDSPRDDGGDREQRGTRERNQPIILSFDDRNRLVVADESGLLRTWPGRTDREAIRPILTLPLPRINGPQRGFWYPSLSRTTDGRSMLVMSHSSGLFLWRSVSPRRLMSIHPPGSDHEPTSDLDRSTSNPKAILNPPSDGSGRIPRAGNGGRSFTGFRYSFPRIAREGDRIYLVDSGILQAWDLHQSGDHVQARKVEWHAPPRDVTALTLSPDGSLLAVGSRTGGILLVETSTLRVSASIEPAGREAGDFAQTLAFAPDSRSLAVASQYGPIVVWRLRESSTTTHAGVRLEPRVYCRLPVHRTPVRLLAFDAQGDRLAGAGLDPLVEVWNLKEIRHELARLGLED